MKTWKSINWKTFSHWHLVYIKIKPFGPGLAQLVERLAHRYSESTSLNPGNLTSATVCGARTGCVPTAKRLATVPSEVDLGECTLHSPLQKSESGRTHSGFEPQRRHHQNPKQGYQWSQKRTCVSAKNFNKKKPICYIRSKKIPGEAKGRERWSESASSCCCGCCCCCRFLQFCCCL